MKDGRIPQILLEELQNEVQELKRMLSAVDVNVQEQKRILSAVEVRLLDDTIKTVTMRLPDMKTALLHIRLGGNGTDDIITEGGQYKYFTKIPSLPR